MHNKEVIRSKFESILEHINAISEYTKKIKSPAAYETKTGSMAFDAVMMRLQAIGETLKQIDNKAPEILGQYKEVEWIKIIRLRDIISHHYEKLQSEIVFEICTEFIPLVRKTVKKIIKELK
jgi:uncharacterized protein with HEPN domain